MTDTGSGDPPQLQIASSAGRTRSGSPSNQVNHTTHSGSKTVGSKTVPDVVAFNRHELQVILNVYGRQVAAGEWRDYALDFGPQTAVFSIFRRSSEMPLYRIVKDPRLVRKQGTYCVVTATGLILKRGHELDRVIAVLDKRLKLVE